jgi:hypothetical protein
MPIICESCGMPLDEATTSKFDGRYCIHCQDQQNGELASREQAREGSINAATKFMGKTRAEAEKMADEMMPKLPRWRERRDTEKIEIIDTNAENILEYGVCGYKNIKRAGYPEKIEWLKDRFPELSTFQVNIAGDQLKQVGTSSFTCIFAGFKRAHKGKGYGSLLLKECLEDAKKEKMHGVATVTRKGPFMMGKALFVKNGFEVVDTAPPDFELLVKKFNKNAPAPGFRGDRDERLRQYGKGLTIIRADQCLYTVKNVREIIETTKKEYGIKPEIIDLKNCKKAQNSPCPFGTFCMIYNGKIIAHHPISNTRFTNIMNKEMK